MAIAYQYDADGYYVGETEDYGLLPNNATYTAPGKRDAHIPRWNGESWEPVENHKGREGYLHGAAYTIRDYGPLPEGWSDSPPPPTLGEAITAKLAEVMRGYSAAFAPLEAVYPAAEREGWPLQESEAHALTADLNADPVTVAPVLSALVQLRARGESVAELAAKVLQNAGAWRRVYASLTGQQQRMYGEVLFLAEQDGITAEDVAAYPVEYKLPEGLA